MLARRHTGHPDRHRCVDAVVVESHARTPTSARGVGGSVGSGSGFVGSGSVGSGSVGSGFVGLGVRRVGVRGVGVRASGGVRTLRGVRVRGSVRARLVRIGPGASPPWVPVTRGIRLVALVSPTSGRAPGCAARPDRSRSGPRWPRTVASSARPEPVVGSGCGARCARGRHELCPGAPRRPPSVGPRFTIAIAVIPAIPITATVAAAVAGRLASTASLPRPTRREDAGPGARRRLRPPTRTQPTPHRAAPGRAAPASEELTSASSR